MDTLEQLCAIQQILALGSQYYDKAAGALAQREPLPAGPGVLREIAACGHSINSFTSFGHDAAVGELRALAAGWGVQEAANAFAASLWSAPWIWRAALTGKALGSAMPEHRLQPYAQNNPVCRICGFQQNTKIDAALVWYQAMTSGPPIDGHVPEHLILLRELEVMGNASGLPAPTEYDLWTLAAVFDALRGLPPATRYAKAAQALKDARLLPSGSIHAYHSLRESLAIIGILATPERPGMFTAFTPYMERDERPNMRVEVQAPLAWWDSSKGVCAEVFEKVFGHLRLDRIAVSARPPAQPPLAETLTGALARRRTAKMHAPKKPASAGKGPAETGDVYAIRIREGAWVTAYCHQTGTRGKVAAVLLEFLAGVYPDMPSADALSPRFQGRKDGRWQYWTASMDSTPWVRRIARGLPAPAAEGPAPDRVPGGGASELKHLAHWCFPELEKAQEKT
jgi:hypothetical protein